MAFKIDYTPTYLDNGPFPLLQFYNEAVLTFSKILSKIDGRKSVVTNISGLLSFLFRTKEKCEKINVTGFSEFFTKRDDVDCYVYVIGQDINYLDYLKNNSCFTKPIHLIFFPRYTASACEKLKSLQILDKIKSINGVSFNIFPLDYDLITIYQNNAFRELVLHQDTEILFQVKLAIDKLQSEFGIIPNLYGRGPYAEKIINMLKRKSETYKEKNTSVIEHLIVIDRTVDLKTPLLFQTTYEGMIDEVMGIDLGRFLQTKTNHYIFCNSSNETYAELRDKTIYAVADHIKMKLNEKKNEKIKLKDEHNFLTLQTIELNIQRLGVQLQVAQELIECASQKDDLRSFMDVQASIVKLDKEEHIFCLIEELMAKNEPLSKVLRLICLHSIVNGGINKKYAQLYFNSIVQTYGLKNLMTLKNCLKTCLIQINDIESVISRLFGKSRPRHVIKQVESFDKIVQDYFNSFRSPRNDSSQDHLNSINKAIVSKLLPAALLKANTNESDVTTKSEAALIFIIGGINHDEIITLRTLSKKLNFKFVIATTDITNGDKLIDSLVGTL